METRGENEEERRGVQANLHSLGCARWRVGPPYAFSEPPWMLVERHSLLLLESSGSWANCLASFLPPLSKAALHSCRLPPVSLLSSGFSWQSPFLQRTQELGWAIFELCPSWWWIWLLGDLTKQLEVLVTVIQLR